MLHSDKTLRPENALAQFVRRFVSNWNSSMSEGQPPPSRLTLFALVFAWSGILHLLSYSDWIYELKPIEYLGFIVNLALAIKPSSFSLFFAAVIQRIAYTISWIPMLRGHLFLEGLLVFGIAIPLCMELWKFKRLRNFTHPEQESLFESFAPFLRVSCLVVYLAVTLSKLNTGFIDRNESAAVQLLYWTAATNPWIPTGPLAQQIAIWGTLVIEGGIPLLLVFRRTRLAGMTIALLFHALLVLVPLKIASFSITMCLLLASYLPRECTQPIYKTFHLLCRKTRLMPFAFISLFGILVVVTSVAYAAASVPLVLKPLALHLAVGAWWWQGAVMLLALWSIRKVAPDPTLGILNLRTWPVRLMAIFLFLNWMCPYLGLKTRSALAMHCNLRTEPGYWNHLMFPESMRIFTFQDHLVTIEDSDHPDFEWLKIKGMKLPWYEFRRWCRLAKNDFFVTYHEGDGLVRHFSKSKGVGSDPRLMASDGMREWFLCFNPVGSTHDYIPALTKRTGPVRNVVPHYDVSDE